MAGTQAHGSASGSGSESGSAPGHASGTDEAAPQPSARSSDAITFEQIRERAYELWERNHRPEGFEIEFWLLAERELRKERDRRKANAAPAAPRSDPPPA
ncbi:hypothetical protein MFUR16E_29640 [Methylobacterium fujisawaense]|uniref:DUF2934 domain-containing protein n=1 Tax=Methylobacterium TaxID=407 RepID=UPI002DD43092|nr:DUF2934 domain-containing protein [Methylobacterium oryzae]